MDISHCGNHAEGMTPRERHLSLHVLAPTLLLMAVGVVIVAQFWRELPLAGAIALAAWGTAIAVGSRLNGLALAVYAPLTALAIVAQLDAAAAGSLLRQFVAAFDAGAAGGLLVLLTKRVLNR
jgi:hypothetical protein